MYAKEFLSEGSTSKILFVSKPHRCLSVYTDRERSGNLEGLVAQLRRTMSHIEPCATPRTVNFAVQMPDEISLTDSGDKSVEGYARGMMAANSSLLGTIKAKWVQAKYVGVVVEQAQVPHFKLIVLGIRYV